MGVKDTANLAMIPAAYAEDKVYSVLPSDGDGDFTFTRTGSGTRINKGGYIETMAENVPRLNYRLDADGNPTGCAELLLEESRTNNLLRSEEFDNAAWTKFSAGTGTNPVVTANYSISPDGSKNADRVVFDRGSGAGSNDLSVIRQIVSSVGQGVSSVYIKSNTNDNYIIAIDEIGLVTRVTVTPQWQRFTYSETTNDRLQLSLRGGNTSDYADVSVWGAQMEAGTQATSYIKTTSLAVTRNKDSAYNQPFGDLASDYPITVYWKGRITNYSNLNSAFSIKKNGSLAKYLNINFTSSTSLTLRRDDGTEDVDVISYNSQLGDVKKIAIKFTSNTTAKVYIDGIEIYNLSSGLDIDWDFDSVLIGQLTIVSDFNKRNPCDELFVWNKALTDAEMVEVTSYDTFREMATGQQFTIQ